MQFDNCNLKPLRVYNQGFQIVRTTFRDLFVWSEVLRPSHSYGHVGMVSYQTTLFYLGKLDEAVNQYFVYIFSRLVTDNNPSLISGREEKDHRNYFMINPHKSI